ncbi:MAG: hypothetical protein EZS28_022178 [Streblomastix strix]|uniref:Uncharacterized protein n=1 Tax=Streblomastix strix TaxID=222440 RepID=A0A5J4VIQ5_9EUKA|nr:MAG: hypothetical protein EZS28_022178 [Streblomastix strix]
MEILNRETRFLNLKLGKKEEGYLSEAQPQAQILLMSHTRTRSKTSSADSQMRAPGRFQRKEIHKRTIEDIQILEIFPRIQMEETLQPQPDMGLWGKTIRYLEAWKLVKGVEFIQKKVFLSIQNLGQREVIVRETEDLSDLGLKRRGNTIHREIRGRIKRKHN